MLTISSNFEHSNPPLKDGVSASKVLMPNCTEYLTVYAFLVAKFSHIHPSEWQLRFEQKQIFSETGEILKLNSPYKAGQFIFYYRWVENEPVVPFDHHILFENEDLLVVDKPHFLTISPTGQYVQQTLLTRLKKQAANEALSPIHRLDRETAGLVLISKRKQTRHAYQALFANRYVEKIYHAIAAYSSEHSFPVSIKLALEKGEPFYTMRVNPDAMANTETRIECIEHNQSWAKYRLKPITGKQHQLRVHMSAIDLALKNDPFYPNIQHKAKDDFSQPLQLLAKSISFLDPLTGLQMHFESSRELDLPIQANEK